MNNFKDLKKNIDESTMTDIKIWLKEIYAFHIVNLEVISRDTNIILKATSEFEGYTVRICNPGWRSEADYNSEIFWLNALKKTEEIHAPIPVRSKNGKYLQKITIPGFLPDFFVIVFHWLPGNLLSESLTERNVAEMGKLFARLHTFSKKLIIPQTIEVRKMRSVFAREEPFELLSEKNKWAFTAEEKSIIKEVIAKVEKAYARLYNEKYQPILIHHDLWHANILIQDELFQPFDFEDTALGFPVQDIAMAMLDLEEETSTSDYRVLYPCFKTGYTTLAEWPEIDCEEIDTFRIGRMIWVANYVARFENKQLKNYLKKKIGIFKNFLESGKLELNLD